MPAKVFKTSKRKVILDARPDRPDLRDRIYQPPLVSLPPEYPPPKWISIHLQKYCKAGLILNQGEEGACTGFGLAGVINYLLYRQCLVAKLPPPPRVSMRMIYHLARKYDEWPGEDYEGSSCRGAMRGGSTMAFAPTSSGRTATRRVMLCLSRQIRNGPRMLQSGRSERTTGS